MMFSISIDDNGASETNAAHDHYDLLQVMSKMTVLVCVSIFSTYILLIFLLSYYPALSFAIDSIINSLSVVLMHGYYDKYYVKFCCLCHFLTKKLCIICIETKQHHHERSRQRAQTNTSTTRDCSRTNKDTYSIANQTKQTKQDHNKRSKKYRNTNKYKNGKKHLNDIIHSEHQSPSQSEHDRNESQLSQTGTGTDTETPKQTRKNIKHEMEIDKLSEIEKDEKNNDSVLADSINISMMTRKDIDIEIDVDDEIVIAAFGTNNNNDDTYTTQRKVKQVKKVNRLRMMSASKSSADDN